MSSDAASERTRASLLVRLRSPEDASAWSEFVECYGALVLSWCRRWGLQNADAEDVTQTVLFKLAGHLRKFEYDPKRRFRGYLKTAAHNAWSDLRAAQGRAVVATGESGARAALESAEARDDLSQRLERAFDEELLQTASERVRARVEMHTWDAFRLTALEGRTPADVAAALDMQVGTVYKAKSKVQQMLREEIVELEGADTSADSGIQ